MVRPPPVENSVVLSQNLGMELPYDPPIPLLGVNSEELEAGTQILAHQCPQQPYSE